MSLSARSPTRSTTPGSHPPTSSGDETSSQSESESESDASGSDAASRSVASSTRSPSRSVSPTSTTSRSIMSSVPQSSSAASPRRSASRSSPSVSGSGSDADSESDHVSDISSPRKRKRRFNPPSPPSDPAADTESSSLAFPYKVVASRATVPTLDESERERSPWAEGSGSESGNSGVIPARQRYARGLQYDHWASGSEQASSRASSRSRSRSRPASEDQNWDWGTDSEAEKEPEQGAEDLEAIHNIPNETGPEDRALSQELDANSEYSRSEQDEPEQGEPEQDEPEQDDSEDYSVASDSGQSGALELPADGAVSTPSHSIVYRRSISQTDSPSRQLRQEEKSAAPPVPSPEAEAIASDAHSDEEPPAPSTEAMPPGSHSDGSPASRTQADDVALDADASDSESDHSLSDSTLDKSFMKSRRGPLETVSSNVSKTAVAEPALKNHRRPYRQKYVDLLNESIREAKARQPYINEFSGSSYQHLRSTIDDSEWTGHEKVRFFEALVTTEPGNIITLSNAVGTKSPLECQAYLQQLKDANKYKHYKTNITAKHIPAAVELSTECVEALEKQADALANEHRRYEETLEKYAWGDLWQIKMEEAEHIDELYEAENLDEIHNIAPEAELLNVHNMLILSDRIFQKDLPEEDKDPPGMRYTALADLHALVVSLTRRLVQTTIWMAQSRIRAMDKALWRPEQLVKHFDVHAGVDMLKLPHNSKDYWTYLPRRAGLSVFRLSHDVRYLSKMGGMPYDEVEAEMKVVAKEFEKRFGKSVPLPTPQSADDAGEAKPEADFNTDDEELEYLIEHEEGSEEGGEGEDEEGSDNGSDITITSAVRFDLELGPNQDRHRRTLRTAHRRRWKRNRAVDAEEDVYLESLDAAASHAAERDLWTTVLSNYTDVEPPAHLHRPSPPLADKPTKRGFLEPRYPDWRADTTYITPWEAGILNGEPLPKRRRIGNEGYDDDDDDDDDDETEEMKIEEKGDGAEMVVEEVVVDGPSRELQKVVEELRRRSSQRDRRKSTLFEGLVSTVDAVEAAAAAVEDTDGSEFETENRSRG